MTPSNFELPGALTGPHRGAASYRAVQEAIPVRPPAATPDF